jgi:hypothetical protein
MRSNPSSMLTSKPYAERQTSLPRRPMLGEVPHRPGIVRSHPGRYADVPDGGTPKVLGGVVGPYRAVVLTFSCGPVYNGERPPQPRATHPTRSLEGPREGRSYRQAHRSGGLSGATRQGRRRRIGDAAPQGQAPPHRDRLPLCRLAGHLVGRRPRRPHSGPRRLTPAAPDLGPERRLPADPLRPQRASSTMSRDIALRCLATSQRAGDGNRTRVLSLGS